MSQMKQIVVGVDGSVCSRGPLGWAHAEALEHGAELVSHAACIVVVVVR